MNDDKKQAGVAVDDAVAAAKLERVEELERRIVIAEEARELAEKNDLISRKGWQATLADLARRDELLTEAMHCLLYVDAHMLTERVPVAEKIAKLIKHPWPPYSDAEDEDAE